MVRTDSAACSAFARHVLPKYKVKTVLPKGQLNADEFFRRILFVKSRSSRLACWKPSRKQTPLLQRQQLVDEKRAGKTLQKEKGGPNTIQKQTYRHIRRDLNDLHLRAASQDMEYYCGISSTMQTKPQHHNSVAGFRRSQLRPLKLAEPRGVGSPDRHQSTLL